jgi:hypothetical protein
MSPGARALLKLTGQPSSISAANSCGRTEATVMRPTTIRVG